jgi:phage RecT family recombinase
MSNQITVEAGKILDEMAPDIAPLLRENGQSFDRLRSVFLIAVMQEPKILECTPESLRREISKCAADGLVPDSKEAVLLPYWDNKDRKLLANYQPMVQGIIKRVKELGGVFNIVCKLVHENDEFILNEADPDSLVHKSDPFAKEEQRGAVVGGYAVFRDEQKRVMHLETMSAEDFQKVRDASKAPDSPAWKKWRNEMYRKAVLRRGSKYVPINNDKIRALLERQDDMFDFNQPRTLERTNPFTGEVFEGTATKAIENKPAVNMDEQVDKQDDRQQEPVQQRRETKGKGKQQQAERSSQAKSGGATDGEKQDAPTTEAKKDRPTAPPSLPEVLIAKEDQEKVLEAAEKILAIALNMELEPSSRRGVLKEASVAWKAELPEYLHELLRAFIDATDWAIRTDNEKQPWAADHAVFVHKVKALLEVEKLNIGKYP